jgi:hypothetical protein
MSKHSTALAALFAGAAGIMLMANVASATPATHALALKDAAPGAVETVRWRRGWGWGGVAAGVAIGSALAAPYYYGYGPYPYYSAPYPYYAPQPYGGPDAVAYCAQRYRSYDPRTGTFMGLDGLRHPCP